MKVVGIIPSRYESSRFPGKPLVDIRGKPMIQHVYERACKCQNLDGLLVATDDQRIVRAVEAFGGKSVLTRNDHESGTDRIFEASEALGLMDSDIVVNIQGDEPLLMPEMIEHLVDTLQVSFDRKMATLAFASHDREEYLNPNVVKLVTDSNGCALYFSRSPLPYFRNDRNNLSFLKHLGFYAYRQSFLRLFTGLPQGRLEKAEKLEQLRAMEHGHTIHVALSSIETHGVDTPEDLEKILKTNRQDW
ncbi:MAG: 3-deoxy-manno-octulosonate cytidylyltransferase [Desulfoferrobacter sp.]